MLVSPPVARKGALDPLKGFDDLHVDEMRDANYQPRPAEAPHPFGVAVHSPDLTDRLIDGRRVKRPIGQSLRFLELKIARVNDQATY
jgi:hypothetical protein